MGARQLEQVVELPKPSIIRDISDIISDISDIRDISELERSGVVDPLATQPTQRATLRFAERRVGGVGGVMIARATC